MIYLYVFSMLIFLLALAYFTWAALTDEVFRFVVSSFLIVIGVVSVFIARDVQIAYKRVNKQIRKLNERMDKINE